VVAADGALSFLAQDAGLRKERTPRSFAVGLKEVIAVSPELIEERFNLEAGTGAARLYMGQVTAGLPGGGFIYTNKKNLSLGLVVHASALHRLEAESGLPDLLEQFKARPEVAPLLKGGETVEYGAHLVPEGGYPALPALGEPGLLLAGDAAGLVLNTGITLRGMDLALASGTMAGQAIVEAKKQKLDQKTCLERYIARLKNSFILKEMRARRKAPAALSISRLYQRYPQAAVALAQELFQVGPSGQGTSLGSTFKKLRRQVLGLAGYRDLWRLIKM
jgi:electron transfer flavoprotein-quinone oxidoreductase